MITPQFHDLCSDLPNYYNKDLILSCVSISGILVFCSEFCSK